MLVVSLLCGSAVMWCAAMQCEKSVRRDQTEQISDRRKVPVRNYLQQGEGKRKEWPEEMTTEGMTTSVALIKNQLSSPNKPCGVTTLHSFRGVMGGERVLLPWEIKQTKATNLSVWVKVTVLLSTSGKKTYFYKLETSSMFEKKTFALSVHIFTTF